MLKKIMILLLTLVFAFSLIFSGCGKSEVESELDTKTSETDIVTEEIQVEETEEEPVEKPSEEVPKKETVETKLQAQEGEVSFTTEDGIQLNGNIFGTGERWVILSHMYPTDQTSWFDFAEYLKDNGYIVLTYDFRGYGKSGGSKDVSIIDKDLEAALNYIKQYDPEKIFLIGASMGGTASLIVASRQEVNGVISLSSPAEWEGLSALKAVANIQAPKLFIASKGDDSAASSADALYQASLEPKSLKILEGKSHGIFIFEEEPENGEIIKQQILNFLNNI